MIEYTHSFLFALILTVLSETVTLFFLLRLFLRVAKEKISNFQLFFAGFFASFSTITYVWYVFPNLINWTRGTSIHYSEIFVVLLEAFFYRVYFKTSTKNSLLISLICNSISFSLGQFLRFVGLWPF
jgi:hypothetical protein